jgi:hypothetical protein
MLGFKTVGGKRAGVQSRARALGIWGSNARCDLGIQREVGFGDPTRGGIWESNANRDCRSNAHLEYVVCRLFLETSRAVCACSMLKAIFPVVNPRVDRAKKQIERAMGSQIPPRVGSQIPPRVGPPNPTSRWIPKSHPALDPHILRSAPCQITFASWGCSNIKRKQARSCCAHAGTLDH